MGLTVKQVLSAKPGRLSDGAGLYLLVKPKRDSDGEIILDANGQSIPASKSWVLRVMHKSKRRDYGLGSFTPDAMNSDIPLHKRRSLTLAEAREKARVGRELAKAGISPSAEWRQEDQVVPTFEVAARRYHKEVSKAWREGKHGDQWINTLADYAFPLIGAKQVSDIDAPAIQRVLLPIWLSKSETARRVKQRIGVVLDYSHGQGWRDTEAPMRAVNQLMGGVRQPKAQSFASMPAAELPPFMAKLGDGDASVGRLALQFLILTAARSGEVRGAKWSEVNLEASEWRIPAKRMKANKVHIVPLVPAAVAILKGLEGLFEVDPDAFIFPGMKGVMSDATLSKVLRVNGGGAYTVHGFRSTFRDWAADNGFTDSWAEAALAHGNPDKTEAAYRRTNFFSQRRDKLMPAWAAFAVGGQ